MRSLLIGRDKLVLPGTSDRLVIQEFVQSLVPSQFLLHARVSTSGKTGYWLFDSKSGDLKPIAAEITRLSWENTFSPFVDLSQVGIWSWSGGGRVALPSFGWHVPEYTKGVAEQRRCLAPWWCGDEPAVGWVGSALGVPLIRFDPILAKKGRVFLSSGFFRLDSS